LAKDLDDPLEPGGGDEPEAGGSRVAWLSLAALGVVYGDIGTSPLYALRACFHGRHAVEPSPENVLGVLSLVLWALVIVVSVKYLLYILRADNRGEGGILALMALLLPSDEGEGPPAPPGRLRGVLVAVGLFGAALLYADGTITPAISVLSSIEGLEVATPVFEPYVLPIAVGVLVGLFALQRRGTEAVGRLFGPVMAVWFIALAALGGLGVARHPGTLGAANPLHAVRFFAANGGAGYVVLASVFLVVTGGEALYADVGHFGRRPVRLAWFGLVLPALLLNYFGQGALMLAEPSAVESPFYRLAPAWALYPLVVLATGATVIASQAVISGAFSLTRQAIQLGYCPRMDIEHTSAEQLGQVYLPGVNWALMIVTIGLAAAFGRSANLAGAYGMAVSTTMVITTLLASWVAVEQWGWNAWAVGALSAGFLTVDLAFFGANLTKILAGGWFPLLLAGALFLLTSTWKRGKELIGRRSQEDASPLEEFVEQLPSSGVRRIPGTAVFLTATPSGTPVALLRQREYNQVIHEQVVVLTIVATRSPRVPARQRVVIRELPFGFNRVWARYGFLQTPRVPSLLRICEKEGLEIDADSALFFLTREIPIATEKIGMAKWRAHLFSFLARNQRRASTFFHLPHERVIELGVEVEL
jgi:KUP system potassium uptake protein